MVMEELQDQQDISKVPPQLQPHVFRKGQSGNPAGRTPGKSVKERAQAMLRAMNDEEFEEFLHGIDKRTVWEMAEGKAAQTTDITTNGKDLPTPILGYVPTDNKPKEDPSA